MNHRQKLSDRRSVRLPHYDYSQTDFYFITICTYERQCTLGEIAHKEMHLSAAGNIVQSIWTTLPKRFPGLELDDYVIMPNHIHGILAFTRIPPVSNSDDLTHTQHVLHAPSGSTATSDQPASSPALGEVIRTFKAAATYHIRGGGMPAFAWQGRFYDNIIRDEAQLAYIRHYIANNPALWEEDSLHMHA
ncbi:MAG: transposase [Ktedonobacteraceae bacterium]|nr:transposase [Ktedonobacteraceae bacterium]